MQIQLIRNATMRITYAGHLILVDPFFSPQGALESKIGPPNPLVGLPFSPEKIIKGTEMVLVSHLHFDHFDPPAWEILAKDIPLFCQPGDETTIIEKGFKDVRPIGNSIEWEKITISRTPGRHGSAAGVEKYKLGKVSGFIFEAPGEPKIYWAGDSVLYDDVRNVIRNEIPDIILTHSCGSHLGDGDLILMDDVQTMEILDLAPQATVIAIHMEVLNHGKISRIELRQSAEDSGVAANRLLIPADGETIDLEKKFTETGELPPPIV